MGKIDNLMRVGAVAAGLIAGETNAAAQRQSESTTQAEKAPKSPDISSNNAQIKKILADLEKQNDPAIKKSAEQRAYKQIIDIIFKALGKYTEPQRLSEQEQAKLQTDVVNMGLSIEIILKCKDAAADKGEDIASIKQQKLFSMILLSLTKSFQIHSPDITMPPRP
jgi:uncharacterized protein with gpF-like domain